MKQSEIYCSGIQNCDICSSALHDPALYSSTNKNYQVFKQRQEIFKIKTLTNCSYKEASIQIPNTQSYEMPTENLGNCHRRNEIQIDASNYNQ